MAVLISSIIILIITKLYEKPIRNNVKRKQEGNREYNEQVSNILGGLEVIKLYQVEDKFRGPFYKIVKRLEMIKNRTNLLQESQYTILEWFANTVPNCFIHLRRLPPYGRKNLPHQHDPRL